MASWTIRPRSVQEAGAIGSSKVTANVGRRPATVEPGAGISSSAEGWTVSIVTVAVVAGDATPAPFRTFAHRVRRPSPGVKVQVVDRRYGVQSV